MGDNIKQLLTLEERTVHGKKVAALRRQNVIPGVVYGADTEPINVQVDSVVFTKAYRKAGQHHPLHITVGAKKKIAMIKEITYDPVKHVISHVAFHAVKQNEPVIADIPIRLIDQGESAAEKAGLIILQTLEKAEVKALPMDLPDAIEISIKHLQEPGEKVTLQDAKLPENVEFIEHDDGHHNNEDERQSVADQLVASVWEPAALQAQNEAAAGAAGEADAENVEADNGDDAPQSTTDESQDSSDTDKKE